MNKILLLLTLFFCLATQTSLAATMTGGEMEPPTVTIMYFQMCQNEFTPQHVIMTGTGNYTGGQFSSFGGLDLSSDGSIIPALSTPGTHVVTYTIAATTEYPMVQATTNVIILPVIIPDFAPMPPFCVGEPVPVLPTVSNNGVTGTWSPSTVNNEVPGIYTYTFTPDFFCAQPFVMTVNVVECAGIRLKAFLDTNVNGVHDSNEVDFPVGQFAYQQNDMGPFTEVLAPTGTYNINDSNTSNSYDVTFSIVPPYDTFYQASILSITNLSPATPFMVHEFPVTVLQSFEDLNVSIVPVEAPRPGFNYQNRIVYTNYGNVAASGTVAFAKDANVTIGSVSEAGISNNANGFAFGFTNLQPFETRAVSVIMQVAMIPTVEIGQTLTNSATIADSGATVTDTASVTQTIIGSYDPNDKTEIHGPEIVWETFTSNDYLEYTIRFENTGTAAAEKIRIVDVLDAKLNPQTIGFVASSHPCALEKSGNQLTFVIDDVQLPPSVPDTEIGKGFVTFRIKPTGGYALGDIIPNTASIYFDFNPAIVTEEWNTEFVAPLATNAFTANSFVLYPNPADDVLNVRGSATSERLLVVVHDMLGKTVLTETVSGQSLNIAKLEPGMYLVSVTSGASKSVQKLIVK